MQDASHQSTNLLEQEKLRADQRASPEEIESADVSCGSLTWTFEFCAQRNIDPRRITRNVLYSIEHLKDTSRFIDWRSFVTFISNFSNYLTEAELLDAGRNSWKSGNLKVHSYIGRLLFNVRDQYLELFGPLGALVKLYPLEMSVIQMGPRRLRVFLTMKPGFPPSYTFHKVLAGQMMGLPESLGYPPAEVEINQLDNGASFDISYSSQGGLLAPLRRSLMWPFNARQTAKELNLTYSSLLDKYRELQEETRKLKISEQKAEQSNERYRLIATNVNDIVWTMNSELEIEYINPAVLSITGYSEYEITNMPLEKVLTNDSLKAIREFIKNELHRTDHSLAPSTIELPLKHKDGHPVWIEVKTAFVRDKTEKAISLTGIARDITEQKVLQGKISEQETSYQAITNTAQDAIITINKDNNITFANPASVRIFGYEISEMIGMDATILMPEALGETQLRDLYRHQFSVSRTGVTLKGLRKDRTLIPLDISFASHEFRGDSYHTCIIRDISVRNEIEQERKKLEQQLLASQKMESIGQLTGGIAHDFNNLLVAILGYTDLAIANTTGKDNIREYLEEIKYAGERAADMTQKLLAFSRRQIIEPKLIDANQLIKGLELMVNRLLPENIEVVCNITNHELNVMADLGQLEQVLINLSVNARDAMPSGGSLKIEVSKKTIEADFVYQNTFAREGEFVAIRVTDTGVGMGQDVQKRIFEPFFTTKPEGSGTGLGLAMVFGIVKQHEGFIDVESHIGTGTTFTVYLPLASDRTQQATSKIKRAVTGGNETIFVVEDNNQVRNLARLILKGAGYEVLDATDGIDALEIFKINMKVIDLVVMDVVMPRMGGREAMEQMRRMKPGIKIIFTSGYSASGIHANFILEEGLEFIPKPYSTDTLRARVRAVLDNETTRQSRERLL
ncbi:MAG: PAS domain S-box protein [Proteobacteria bacterium]|nr:PAS domain S-box protein [Pseudomonadota bacterium]